MKIYINRAPVCGPWGGGNLWAKAAYVELSKLGHELLDPLNFRAAPDVIVLAGLDGADGSISAEQAIMYKMYVNPNVKLVGRINENDARKATTTVDGNLVTLSEYLDATVFVSNWLQDYFVTKGWKCKKNTVVYNGVDADVFGPRPKLDNNKTNIVTHHWSNNHLKGFDIYDELDKFVGDNTDFTFTYIGRENGKFKNTTVVRPLFGKSLGDELGKYDVYVSASRFDPGPNHCLESLSANIPTYVHNDGGGAVEFAGSDHTFKNWDELKAILISKSFQNNSAIQLIDWTSSILQYARFIESL